mmetsp:Transcript_2298/g.9563  ORF Transcript_2298/g.9563 Transcript_2298/m.9563 type:complete len:455 (-) Transcript_2298:907-2271(-)
MARRARRFATTKRRGDDRGVVTLERRVVERVQGRHAFNSREAHPHAHGRGRRRSAVGGVPRLFARRLRERDSPNCLAVRRACDSKRALAAKPRGRVEGPRAARLRARGGESGREQSYGFPRSVHRPSDLTRVFGHREDPPDDRGRARAPRRRGRDRHGVVREGGRGRVLRGRDRMETRTERATRGDGVGGPTFGGDPSAAPTARPARAHRRGRVRFVLRRNGRGRAVRRESSVRTENRPPVFAAPAVHEVFFARPDVAETNDVPGGDPRTRAGLRAPRGEAADVDDVGSSRRAARAGDFRVVRAKPRRRGRVRDQRPVRGGRPGGRGAVRRAIPKNLHEKTHVTPEVVRAFHVRRRGSETSARRSVRRVRQRREKRHGALGGAGEGASEDRAGETAAPESAGGFRAVPLPRDAHPLGEIEEETRRERKRKSGAATGTDENTEKRAVRFARRGRE